MTLQQVQPQGVQAQSVHALANMEQAEQAAEIRVQRATDETFSRLQEALRQSEVNNRTLAERNASSNSEILALKQRVLELSLAQETQAKALEEQNKALLIQFKALQDNTAKLELNLDTLKNKFEGHTHSYTSMKWSCGDYHYQPATTSKPTG